MRRGLVFIFIFCVSVVASAISCAGSTPDEVMKSYKAYNTALEQKDFDEALGHAKTAWQKAETALGDSNITGKLAYNYGYLMGVLGKSKGAVEPLIRSVDLAHLAKQDVALIRLEREVGLVSVMIAIGERSKAWKRLGRGAGVCWSK